MLKQLAGKPIAAITGKKFKEYSDPPVEEKKLEATAKKPFIGKTLQAKADTLMALKDKKYVSDHPRRSEISKFSSKDSADLARLNEEVKPNKSVSGFVATTRNMFKKLPDVGAGVEKKDDKRFKPQDKTEKLARMEEKITRGLPGFKGKRK